MEGQKIISARKKLILQQSGTEVFATKLYTHMPVTFVTIEKREEEGIGPRGDPDFLERYALRIQCMILSRNI